MSRMLMLWFGFLWSSSYCADHAYFQTEELNPGFMSTTPRNNYFHYFSGTNKLEKISPTAGGNVTSPFATNNRSFTYDKNGNLATDALRGTNLFYDRANLPYRVTGNNQTYAFGYNTADARIFKGNDNQAYYYLAGSIYDMKNDQWEHYPGGLAVHKNNSLNLIIKDHLTNIRAVVSSDYTACSSTTYEAQYDYYPYGKVLRKYENPRSRFQSTDHETDIETGYNNRNARWYDDESLNFLHVDPLADHPRQIGMSPYSAFWNNPIRYNDPDGRCPDCPNGEYQVQKGDNFWALEKKWNMPQGSLAGMNKGVDPTKLQIGQTINTTLSQTDLPAGVTLHSSNSMNGMDGFFKKGTEGVNRIINVSESGYDKFANALANVSEGGISENTTGGNMDAKKYFLANKEQYSTDTKTWFKEQTSVTEPNTRALFVYKGIGYNINEFGNLSFGSAKAINGVNLNVLIGGGHIYSIFSNGKMDDPNEVKAVKRGYGYYKK